MIVGPTHTGDHNQLWSVLREPAPAGQTVPPRLSPSALHLATPAAKNNPQEWWRANNPWVLPRYQAAGISSSSWFFPPPWHPANQREPWGVPLSVPVEEVGQHKDPLRALQYEASECTQCDLLLFSLRSAWCFSISAFLIICLPSDTFSWRLAWPQLHTCNVSGWPSRSVYDLVDDGYHHHHRCCYQMMLLLSMLSEVVEVV